MALMKAFSEFSLELKDPLIKVELSPFKKNCVICFNESLLKMMKKACYFILKALFVLKMFKFFSLVFGHIEKAT